MFTESLTSYVTKTFGDQNIVCIDSTHGTNSYHFTLTTILVVDEFGEGYPCALCISNGEDFFVLDQFFKAIKEKIKSITPKWFMSNDADQFYNAWRSVFGPAENKLLCTWHVDQAWRQKLHLISDKTTQATVYRNLRVLMEGDIEIFEELLIQTQQQ